MQDFVLTEIIVYIILCKCFSFYKLGMHFHFSTSLFFIQQQAIFSICIAEKFYNFNWQVPLKKSYNFNWQVSLHFCFEKPRFYYNPHNKCCAIKASLFSFFLACLSSSLTIPSCSLALSSTWLLCTVHTIPKVATTVAPSVTFDAVDITQTKDFQTSALWIHFLSFSTTSWSSSWYVGHSCIWGGCLRVARQAIELKHHNKQGFFQNVNSQHLFSHVLYYNAIHMHWHEI